MDTVLFACVHNAGRSQMAAAWFQRLADPSKARAVSAGTQPAAHVHPEVARALAEEGLAEHLELPRRLTPELARTATLLVTMGCGESCPAVPGLGTEDWAIRDPKGLPIEEVRAIAREIRQRVEELIQRRNWARPG